MTAPTAKLHGYINPKRDALPQWLQRKLDTTWPDDASAFAVGKVISSDGDSSIAFLFVLEDESIVFVSVSESDAADIADVISYTIEDDSG